MTHTKISQAIERQNPPNQIILRHMLTDTYIEAIAPIIRPIYF
jgi:hypothetical protein